MDEPELYEFDKSRITGDEGEREVARAMSARGYIVTPTIGDLQWQGVDFIITSTSGIEYSVEVKSDDRMHETGNVFMETMSNKETGRKGCIPKTKAQYLVYVDMHTRIQYWSKAVDVKNKIKSWSQRYKTKTTRTKRGIAFFTTEGIIVPFSEYVLTVDFEQYHNGLRWVVDQTLSKKAA